MDFLYLADTSNTPPSKPVNPARGYPTNGDPVNGKAPTTLGAWIFYAWSEEFKNLLATAGIQPSADNLHQLADYFNWYMAKVESLSPVDKAIFDAKVAEILEALNRKAEVFDILALLPTGATISFIGKEVPSGYLLCNGATVKRAQYPNLARLIGGISAFRGDGTTTFTLPNYNGRVPQGTTDLSKVGTYVEAGLPNITGSFGDLVAREVYAVGSKAIGKGLGAFQAQTNNFGGLHYVSDSMIKFENSDTDGISFDASRSSALYGNSSGVQPHALLSLFLIKT